MAVYTEVGFEAADTLLQSLGLGALTELTGIKSGIENTNYYATTVRGQWVLTLFERLTPQELPYYLQLMQHLARHGIPVPAPQAAANGSLVHQPGRPAGIGGDTPARRSHRLAPALTHCANRWAAWWRRMHVAGLSGPGAAAATPARPGLVAGYRAHRGSAHMAPAQAELLRDELAFQQHLAASPAGQTLPSGPIHADLFRDNVMFDDTAGPDTLCGFFDFYFAGTDWLLFDVAVCLNDWCSDPASGALDDARATAFMAAYQPLNAR